MSKLIGSRVARREQLSQQERLIEQRRREIESKLRQSEDINDCKKDTIDVKTITEDKISDSVESIGSQSTTSSTPDINCDESASNSSSQLVNRFKNDGSFFTQFLQMQKTVEPNGDPEVKTESKDSKQVIKPIKMVIKEKTSKLRAVSSAEESNVKLCVDDDIKEVKDIQLAIERTAISVTMNGIEAEETMRRTKDDDIRYIWLRDKESQEYKCFEKRVKELSEAKIRAQNDDLFSDEVQTLDDKERKKRKSRWSDEKVVDLRDPAVIQYALQVFGTTELTADQWKQLEDQRKMKMLFEILQRKQKANQMLANSGKVKYEYDSDEDTAEGTWEHKRRRQEMAQTHVLASELTEKATGKHHIGDFMPPEELEKFMLKWESMKEGMPIMDESDYRDSKLQSDNVGFQMLKKLGWVEGQGLGADGTGIADPVNKAIVGTNNAGLGQTRPEDLKEGDDEYEAYRKRMMMAYRFRPNPMNNPRRSYY